MQIVSIKTVERSFCDKIFDVLPERYKTAYNRLCEYERLNVTEIRIRANMPCSFTSCGRNIPMTDYEKKEVIESSSAEIEDIVIKMCEGSLYAFSEHIKNGYIPFMGTRVGLTGIASFKDGEIKSFISFSSLSIRVPKFLKDAAGNLANYISFKGIENTLIFHLSLNMQENCPVVWLLIRSYRLSYVLQGY